MDKKRLKRIQSELTKEISMLINSDIKDPRIATITSITEIDLTDDLQSAKVYVSVFGNEKEKEETIEGLISSTGFIKRELGSRMNLRHIPDLKFMLDDQVEKALHIESLIDMAIKQDEEARSGREEEDLWFN